MMHRLLLFCIISAVALVSTYSVLAQFTQPLLIGGGAAAIKSITACGSNACSFTPASTNAIGQAVAILVNGSKYQGSWTMPTTGSDHAGNACPNNSAYFTISAAGLLASTTSSPNTPETTCIATTAPVYVQLVTLTPASNVACSIGPSVSAIPAPAAAASFNTCAANFDFTSTSNFVHGGFTYNFSNLATWLDCAITNGNAPLWWRGGATSASWNCTDAQIVNDGGTNAFQLTYYPAESYNSGVFMNTVQPGSGNSIVSLPTGFAFPQQFYVEFQGRMTTPDSNATTTQILYDWWASGATPLTCYLEYDFIEMLSGGGDAGVANECLSQYSPFHHATPSNVPGYNHNNYNIFGERVTMDSSANTAICFYVNGVQLQCDTFQWGANAELHQLERLLMDAVTGPQTITGPITGSTRYFRVFTCSGWNTGSAAGGFACASSPITSNP